LGRVGHRSSHPSYLYDENGIRIKKTVGATTTLYPFGHYEVSGTTVKKYYTFGGMTIAMRTGSTLQYLHTDHLGGVAAVTDSAGVYSTNQSYFAYGKKRAGGTLPTLINYTGQRLDGSGLVYMNARYYDPLVGVFISPDTIVPDAGVLIDYNRFAYGRANPIKYNDPTGHTPWDVVDVGFWLWSARDFYDKPGWGNAGWLALDTVSLLPLVPSAGYLTRGAKFLNGGRRGANTTRRVAQSADLAGDAIELLHGTSNSIEAFANGIEVTRGGGQLGTGFYMTIERSTADWFARNWSRGRDPKLLKMQIPVESLEQLNIIELSVDSSEYQRLSNAWKNGQALPTDLQYLIDDYDAIMAPVITTLGEGMQIKFNPRAQSFLDQFNFTFENLP